jgi:hypothetical protein
VRPPLRTGRCIARNERAANHEDPIAKRVGDGCVDHRSGHRWCTRRRCRHDQHVQHGYDRLEREYQLLDDHTVVRLEQLEHRIEQPELRIVQLVRLVRLRFEQLQLRLHAQLPQHGQRLGIGFAKCSPGCRIRLRLRPGLLDRPTDRRIHDG